MATSSSRPIFAVAVAALLTAGVAAAEPALPGGSVVDPQRESFPAQRLNSEVAGGRQSPMVALGNTAFSSPLLFGAAARAAGLSCNSCHVNGHTNPAFFIPGHSTVAGGFDATSGLFNPRADNGVHDPVDIPSLRGVRFLGPWGHDGRIGSLREFARHVIVDEFAGPEPDPKILDALTAYLNEQDFIPTVNLDGAGNLTAAATEPQKRGAALFRKPFAGMDGKSCASCHVPATAFTDGRTYDVGTGGRFKTATLLDAATSAPYFHDGRAATFADVVDHFDKRFALALSAGDRADLVAYLEGVGAADDPEEPPGFSREMAELAVWTDLLDATIRDGDAKTTRFVADTIVADLARIQRAWPEGDAGRHHGRPDRQKKPVDYPALQDGMRTVAAETDADHQDAALTALADYVALAQRMSSNYPTRVSSVR